MLTEPLPEPVQVVLRQLLFLGPLAAAVPLLARVRRQAPRRAIGAFFAFLFGLALTFAGHAVAIAFGAWSFGGDALKVLGFPADLWFGGALLWGPVLFLAFPRTNPWLFVVPCVVLEGLLLPTLSPFFLVGPHWFLGVVLVFVTAHLPALHLARWTEEDRHLPARAALLAVGHGVFAFLVIPTVIMQAMGGNWAVLADRPGWALAAAAAGLGVACVLGLSAVQLFALHGGGTPIPLDPTKRLVRSGIYAYLCNPMQVSTALGWLVLGAVLGNPWVALAAAMAVCFVLGLVRWHHRQDLERRFPLGWPEYRAHVPEWWPRWRPWIAATAGLRHDPSRRTHRWLFAMLARSDARGLATERAPGPLLYREADDGRDFRGAAALAKALNHGNFATAVVGAALLLAVLPPTAAIAWARRPWPVLGRRRA